MRRLAITLALLTIFLFSTVAFGAIPKAGPFAGKTSLHSINGFYDLVTFASASSGKQLKKFTFGTLGCFGSGSFPVGVDPYGDPTNTAVMKPITVAANGTFSFTGPATLADPEGTVTTATVTGSFTGPGTVSGVITISQTQNGDKCGPAKMKFTAASGTPSSLGLNG